MSPSPTGGTGEGVGAARDAADEAQDGPRVLLEVPVDRSLPPPAV